MRVSSERVPLVPGFPFENFLPDLFIEKVVHVDHDLHVLRTRLVALPPKRIVKHPRRRIQPSFAVMSVVAGNR